VVGGGKPAACWGASCGGFGLLDRTSCWVWLSICLGVLDGLFEVMDGVYLVCFGGGGGGGKGTYLKYSPL
jgi:hypothetical protein